MATHGQLKPLIFSQGNLGTPLIEWDDVEIFTPIPSKAKPITDIRDKDGNINYK